MLRRVVFPAPDAPIIAETSPPLKTPDTLLRMTFSSSFFFLGGSVYVMFLKEISTTEEEMEVYSTSVGSDTSLRIVNLVKVSSIPYLSMIDVL